MGVESKDRGGIEALAGSPGDLLVAGFQVRAAQALICLVGPTCILWSLIPTDYYAHRRTFQVCLGFSLSASRYVFY